MADNTEISDLTFIKQINFKKGFQSWHIKWNLKCASKTIWSDDFHTIIEPEEKSVGLSFGWYLGIHKREDNRFFLGLYQRDLKQPVCVIVRFALQIPGHLAFFNKSCCCFFKQADHGFGFHQPNDFFDTMLDKNMIFHCWIDIPNDIVNFDTNNVQASSPSINLLSITSELFEGVIGKDDEMKSLGDVTLVLSTEKGELIRKFYCDRRILAAHSTVFKRMFANKEWKEGASADERLVEIKGVDENAMETVLEYIYTGRLPNRECEFIPAIIYAADKYDIGNLVESCEAILICKQIGDISRFEHLQLADSHQLQQLKSVCIAALCTNLIHFGSDGDFNVDLDLLREINKEAGKRQQETIEIIVSTNE